MQRLNELRDALMAGEKDKTHDLVARMLAQGVPPKEILDAGLLAGMGKIGELFKNHDIFLPEVLLAARAMQAGMDLLKPHLAGEGIPSRGRVILGTVRGDLHDIGKNLVGIMVGGAGFEVIDLGVDVPPERFIRSALENNAAVIGLSALLTTTMPAMKEVVDLLKKEGRQESIKVIVGGASVSENFARDIGASGYGYDAASAVELVERLAR